MCSPMEMADIEERYFSSDSGYGKNQALQVGVVCWHALASELLYLTSNKAKNVYCKQLFLYYIVGTHLFRTLQLRMCTIELVSYESGFSIKFFSYDVHYEILFIVFMPRHCGLNATLSSRACVL